ncbi:hypothetical protein O0L34_g19123 [Tuta absoluta]|nr:hypothetical protein O0L34_g19123 [Tuta absoluta]
MMAKSTIEALEKLFKRFISPLEIKVNSVLTAIEKLEIQVNKLESQIATKKDGDTNNGRRLSTFDNKLNASKTSLTQVKNAPAKVSKPNGHKATESERARQGSLPIVSTNNSGSARESAAQVRTQAADNNANTNNLQDVINKSKDNILTQDTIRILNNTEQWQVVSNKRHNKRPKRTAVTGTGPQDAELQTTERSKKIHVCFFKPETTAEAIKSYMTRKNDSDNYKIDKLPLKHNHYASFALLVPQSKYEYFITAANWPAGVEVSEWFRSGAGRSSRVPPGAAPVAATKGQ